VGFLILGEEWLILLFLALFLILGPKKIPEVARFLGKARMEFERGKMEIEKELSELRESVSKPVTKTITETIQQTTQNPTEKLARIAEELGIDSTGKSEDDLRKEIIKALQQSKPSSNSE
jgi:sec-independent protein translocase protein TatA